MKKTTITVKTDPPGARAIFDTPSIIANTDEKVIVESSIFKSHLKIDKVHITFEKEGFRTHEVSKALEKGKDHIVSVKLDALDTYLDIKSTPIPTLLKFVSKNGKDIVEYKSIRNQVEKYTLPEGWPKQFTTPIRLEATQKEAQQIMSRVKLLMSDDTGYLPTGDNSKLINGGLDLNLIMATSNEINIILKPVVTTLHVSSNPSGALVKDIKKGGFGIIGKTPVTKKFSWDDFVKWSERQQKKILEGDGKRSISFDLKISKLGYKTDLLKNRHILVGEKRSFNTTLKPIILTYKFSSIPEDVRVAILWFEDRKFCDDSGNNCSVDPIPHKDPWGITPFSKDIGPNDSLKHGNTLIFYKSRYEDIKMPFARDKGSYNEDMELKE